MPNTKTAEKALRQSKRKRVMNLKRKGGIKEATKALKILIADKKTDEAKKQLSVVYKRIDKTAKSNFIKKGKAARLKAKYAKMIG